METQSKQWQTLIQPHCARFKMAAHFGHSISINPKGCAAYAELLADMAMRLDKARDTIKEIEEKLPREVNGDRPRV